MYSLKESTHSKGYIPQRKIQERYIACGSSGLFTVDCSADGTCVCLCVCVYVSVVYVHMCVQAHRTQKNRSG